MLSDRTDDSNAIKQQIERQNVLVKVIESQPGDDTHWLFHLNQLKNPGNNRPVKKLRPEQKRDMTFDAEKQGWVTRKIDKKRGRKKDTVYIKKTSTTMPPGDGKMKYFGSHIKDVVKKENYVGIGFQLGQPDEKLVQIKNKYIFKENILSKDSPWIFDAAKKNNRLKKPTILKSTTLDLIREQNDGAQAKGEILPWNEIIASPSAQAVSFLFAPYDTLRCKLNLLSKRALVKKELGLTLPLFIMGEATAVKEYTLHQQLTDVLFVLGANDKHLKLYLNKIDFALLAAVYHQQHEDTHEQDSQNSLYPKIVDLDEDMGALMLGLYNANQVEQLTVFLNALKSPLTSVKLNECLYKAVKNNHHQLAALLLAKGADINYTLKEDTKRTLALVVENKRYEIFTAIMKLDKDRFTTESLQQALLFASGLGDESSAEYFASRLFKTNVDFKPEGRYWSNTGNYALHTATSNKYLSVIKLICQHGGNPGQENAITDKNKSSKTSLVIAFDKNDYKAVKAMLELGGHQLTAEQRGDTLQRLLRAEQYSMAKSLLNSSADIEINAYDADLPSIITNIAGDETMSELAKQTLALHFINKHFNAATTQSELMNLVKLLKACDAKAKGFLFQPIKGGTSMFHKWNNESVCSFWTSTMKLAKNRLLAIINNSPDQPVEKEAEDFLSTRRINFGFGSSTASADILHEKDEKKRAQRIATATDKLATELAHTYGMRRG